MSPEQEKSMQDWFLRLETVAVVSQTLLCQLLEEQRALRHLLRVALARPGLTVQQMESLFASALTKENEALVANLETLLRQVALERRAWQPPDPPAGADN